MNEFAVQLDKQMMLDWENMIRNMERQIKPYIIEMNQKYIIQFPKVDIAENSKEYIIKVSVPGMDKNDIKISLKTDDHGDGHILTITGVKKIEKELKNSKFKKQESYYGEFKRIIHISKPIEEDKIKAKYDNGNLFITIPKKVEVDKKESKEKIINID